MSRTTPLILVAATLALGSLGACSTMGDKSASANADSAKVVAMQDDAQYVNRVERIARQRGIMLTWVNPPKKHPQPAPTESN